MIELEPGAEFAGHRIEQVAGRGGMGIVYAATDMRLKRTVALKVIAPGLATDPHFQERFERECELAASINHPSVVQIYTAGEEDGQAYVTMRFVEGTDLARLIARDGALDLRLVAKIASSVATALEAAHKRGLVHRDVKPANVLVGERSDAGEVFLTDFGLMRQLTSGTRFTATGAVIGTLDYMAPEQIEDAELDGRTDIYALGCVLYEALTGVVPFPETTPPAKLFAHTRSDRPSIRGPNPRLPAELDNVVQKAMAVKPADRFQTASELAAAVEQAVAAAAPAAPPTAPASTLLAETAAVAEAAQTVEAADAGETVVRGDTAAPTKPPPPPGPPAPPREAPGEEPKTRKVKQRRGFPLTAVGLGAAAVALAVVIGLVVTGGGDDGGGTETQTTTTGTGTTTTTPKPDPVNLPPGIVAEVETLENDGGEIEQSGLDRRTALVELRGQAKGETATAQALDELIFNRWFRGEAEQQGLTFSEEEIAAEQQSSEYAEEFARLAQVGYDLPGIEFDAEVRLTARQLYGDDAVKLLTNGYESTDYNDFVELIDKWGPLTKCEADFARLSSLCINSNIDPREEPF